MSNDEILLKTLQKENEIIVTNCKKKIEEINKTNSEALIELEKQKEINKNLENELKETRDKLNSILYSRSYRITNKIVKLFKK